MPFLTRIWRHPLGVWFLLSLGVFVFWGGEVLRRDLWEPDEARFALVSREMREDGHWRVPHRNGLPYAHKPPLYFWLTNTAATLFTGGEITRFSARAPTLLGAVLALGAVVSLLRLWGRGDRDLHAVLLCATTYLFWRQGGWGQIDMLLCGLQLTALAALFAQDARPSVARVWVAYTCLGLATLAKGPVGLLVPLVAYLAAKLAAGEARDLRRWHWLPGLCLALAWPAAWLGSVILQPAPDGYLAELLWDQNVGRAQGQYGHVKPFYYYLWHFPLDALPWSLVWPFAWRALGRTEEDRRLRARLAGWIAAVLVGFSLSPGKRDLYILLAYPAAAIGLAAAWPGIEWTRAARRVCQVVRFLPAGLALVAGLGVFLLPREWLGDISPARLAVPAVLVLLATAATGRRRAEGVGAPVLPWLAVFAATGALALPLFNARKTPAQLPALVRTHLPPGEPLHLFAVPGEIQVLHARRRGVELPDEEALLRLLATRPRGLVVFERKSWDRLTEPTRARLVPHPYPMGGKSLVAASWGSPGSDGGK